MVDMVVSGFLALGATVLLGRQDSVIDAAIGLAKDGTVVNLFGTLLGFYVTILTVLLALVDHPSVKDIKNTEAFQGIYKSFAFVVAVTGLGLVVSLIVKVTAIIDVWKLLLGYPLLFLLFASAAYLVFSIVYLWMMVKKVIAPKVAKPKERLKEAEKHQ